jgi:hypothetical protein
MRALALETAIALFCPRFSSPMIAVTLPKTQLVVVEKL